MDKEELLQLAYIKVAKAAQLLQSAGEELLAEENPPRSAMPHLRTPTQSLPARLRGRAVSGRTTPR